MEFKYTDVVLRGDKMVKKISQDEKNAYYSVGYEGKTYKFTVPFADIGEAKLLDEDKSVYFARWIRKALDVNEFIEIEK